MEAAIPAKWRTVPIPLPGILRRGIRDALSSHPLVKSFSTPPPKEGGEGVTVVEIAG